MDNFSGHTGRDPTVFWPATGQMRKEVFEGMLTHGCTEVEHEGETFAISALLAQLVPGEDGKAQKKIPGMPNVPELIALGRAYLYHHKPDCMLSACQVAALRDENLVLIFSVPLTPNANPIEYWWGTAKGDLARMCEGSIDAVTIIKRWRDIANKRHMAMMGAGPQRIEVEPNSLCRKYVNAALTWA